MQIIYTERILFLTEINSIELLTPNRLLLHVPKQLTFKQFSLPKYSNNPNDITFCIFSVGSSKSWQIEISTRILWPHGQRPTAFNYDDTEPKKKKEVDCKEPFNSVVPSLKHTVTTVPETDLHTVPHRRHLVHSDRCLVNVTLHVLVEPLGGAFTWHPYPPNLPNLRQYTVLCIYFCKIK